MNSTPKSIEQPPAEHTHVTKALQGLQLDLHVMNARLEELEKHKVMLTNNNSETQSSALTKRSTVEKIGSFAANYNSLPWVMPVSTPSWFPFKDMNWATIAIILSWPVVAQYLVARLRHHRRTL